MLDAGYDDITFEELNGVCEGKVTPSFQMIMALEDALELAKDEVFELLKISYEEVLEEENLRPSAPPPSAPPLSPPPISMSRKA